VEPEDGVRTDVLIQQLDQLRQQVEEIHEELLERLGKLSCREDIAERCTACCRPCKQGASVTVESCPLFRAIDTQVLD
jgi:Ni,Fe-hydrogenase III large subunit